MRSKPGAVELKKLIRSPFLRAAARLAGIFLLSGCTPSAPAASGVHMQRATLQPNHNFSYRTEVLAAARRTSIPPALLLAIIHAESNFNPRAVSHKGAVGLMQLYQGALIMTHRDGVPKVFG